MNSGSEYYHYKSFFSIVLFALVDADYNFLFVDVGSQGRISDSGVFKNTELYKKIESKDLALPERNSTAWKKYEHAVRHTRWRGYLSPKI